MNRYIRWISRAGTPSPPPSFGKTTPRLEKTIRTRLLFLQVFNRSRIIGFRLIEKRKRGKILYFPYREILSFFLSSGSSLLLPHPVSTHSIVVPLSPRVTLWWKAPRGKRREELLRGVLEPENSWKGYARFNSFIFVSFLTNNFVRSIVETFSSTRRRFCILYLVDKKERKKQRRFLSLSLSRHCLILTRLRIKYRINVAGRCS